MADVYYPGIVAGDAAAIQPDGTVQTVIVQPNSTFQVFELADTANTTPLTVKSESGLTDNKVSVGSLPILPDVYVVSPNFAHRWKSGALVFRRDSQDAKDAAVAAAVTAAQAAVSTVAMEVQKAVDSGDFRGPKGLDGSNVLPTATAVAQAITTPGSVANTALSATIAEAIAASGGGGGTAVTEDPDNPGLYDVAVNGSITEDPTTPGLYTIGA